MHGSQLFYSSGDVVDPEPWYSRDNRVERRRIAGTQRCSSLKARRQLKKQERLKTLRSWNGRAQLNYYPTGESKHSSTVVRSDSATPHVNLGAPLSLQGQDWGDGYLALLANRRLVISAAPFSLILQETRPIICRIVNRFFSGPKHK